MPSYICEICEHNCKQKSGYDLHMKRKNPCKKSIKQSIEQLVNSKVELEVEKKLKEVLTNIGEFKIISKNVIVTPQLLNEDIQEDIQEENQEEVNEKTDISYNKMSRKELLAFCKGRSKGLAKKSNEELIQILSTNSTHLSPLVKWSGGKVDEIPEILQFMPTSYHTYLEPFIGGGALYFYLNPQKAVINDIHKELVALYKTVATPGGSKIIKTFMDEYKNTELDYYKVRDKFIPQNDADKGKQFYYLRKTCFRGMLRYNSSGKFNIPYGRYKTIQYAELDNNKYEKLLARTTILNGSFLEVFNNYNDENNFMFLDPPYDSVFTDYGYCSFGKEEHQQLAKAFKETKIKCLMVIGKTDYISELYKGYVKHEYQKRYRFKIHSGRVGDEINVKHLVITNYTV